MSKSTRVQEHSLKTINKELAEVLTSGKFALGSKHAMKALFQGKAKVVIITKKIPPKLKCDFEYHTMLGKIGLLHYPGGIIEVKQCDDKHIRVSALSVTDPGKSNIMNLVSPIVENV